MKLTDHFQLSEFTRSGTASRYGINNTLNPDIPQQAEIIANIKALCTEVLEPLRQHMKGEAADLRIPSLTEGRRWMEWLISNLAFDQCIMEHCKNKDDSTSHWIHVSYSRKRNRQYVISNMWKK